MTAMAPLRWQAPPLWTVTPEWAGQRCWVICGGHSVAAQQSHIPHLTGHIIAVKQAGLLRPDADILFWAGERADELAPPVLTKFRGGRIVVRGRGHPVFPLTAKRLARTVTHECWSRDPQAVAGFDAGTSAINLAILLGANPIFLLGYDMTGGHWFNGPNPPQRDFDRHLGPLPALAADAVRLGIRIVNCSPISVAPFERQPLEACL